MTLTRERENVGLDSRARDSAELVNELREAAVAIRCIAEKIRYLRRALEETDAASNRRKAKSRETELDPKPPVKPVRVAEPSTPRKPKYSGL